MEKEQTPKSIQRTIARCFSCCIMFFSIAIAALIGAMDKGSFIQTLFLSGLVIAVGIYFSWKADDAYKL